MDSAEVRQMIAALARSVAESTDPPGPYEAGMALNGLGSQVDSPELRQMLVALGAWVGRASQPFDGPGLGAALHGLNGLGDTAEVRLLLNAIIPLVAGVTGPVGDRELSMAVYGLHGLGEAPEITILLDILHRIARTNTHPLPVGSFSSSMQALVSLEAQGLDVADFKALLLRRQPREPRGGWSVEAVAYAQALALAGAPVPQSTQCAMEDAPAGVPVNVTEWAILTVLRMAEVRGVEFNVQHVSGFELDILHAEKRVAVELESPTHTYLSPGKAKVRELRAQVLRDEYGIESFSVSTARSLDVVIGELRDIFALGAKRDEASRWRNAAVLSRRGWAWARSRGSCLRDIAA
eukprot:Hpha_TRINITY_DN4245_c0_g1::TRINITY_DN4245_c0_g1_i1::g.186600::m.186600